jgi:hypothetical protein
MPPARTSHQATRRQGLPLMNGTLELATPLTALPASAVREYERFKRREVRRWKVRNFFRQRWREMPLEAALLLCRGLRKVIPGFNMPMHGRLYLRVLREDGEVWDYGMAGVHLVTTAGKAFVASAFDNTVEPELLKFAGFGTGTTAAAIGDTALQTELTTQYATDNVRPTGSQAHSGATYTTVATLSPDTGGTIAVTEWGLLSQAATGGGTLFDRQVFSAVNLVAGSDSLQATYVLTLS